MVRRLRSRGLLADHGRDAVRGEHHHRARGHLVGLLDEDRPALLQAPHHVQVVHDLLADVDRRRRSAPAPSRPSAQPGRRRRSSRAAWRAGHAWWSQTCPHRRRGRGPPARPGARPGPARDPADHGLLRGADSRQDTRQGTRNVKSASKARRVKSLSIRPLSGRDQICVSRRSANKVKEAPANALRSVFASIGQVLLVTDRMKKKSGESEAASAGTPESATGGTATGDGEATTAAAAAATATATEEAAPAASVPAPASPPTRPRPLPRPVLR